MPSRRSGRQYSRKYTRRPSPAYPANRNCGAVKRGNDGTLWRSSRVGRQTACTWKRIGSSRRRSARKSRRSSRRSRRSSRRSRRSSRKSRRSSRRSSRHSRHYKISSRRPSGSGWRKVGYERSVRSGRVRYEWSR
jgi:hypothetical protein